MGRAGDADARRWLLLDLAGVLLRFEPERRIARLAQESGRSETEVERLDDGRADGTALAAALAALIGRPVPIEEAWSLWLSSFEAEAEALAALPALARVWRLGIFTNNPRPIAALLDGRAFDRMFFSSELGATKPDPATYAAVEAALGVDPASIRFVDDGRANVEGALRRGWDALLFRPGDRLARRYDKGERRHKHVGRGDQAEIEFDPDNPRHWIGKCPRNLTAQDMIDLVNEAIPGPTGDRDVAFPKTMYTIHDGAIYEAQSSDRGLSYHGYPYRGRIGRSLDAKLRALAEAKGCVDGFDAWRKAHIVIGGS